MAREHEHGTLDGAQPAPPHGSGQWTVTGVPAFQDNYLWVIHDRQRAVLVDPGDAGPVADFLRRHALRLEAILCTHHHGDHVGGVLRLQEAFGPVPVFGPAGESIPGRTQALRDGAELALAMGSVQVLEVPGHTAGHLAYLWGRHLFCGDTLFALGCGRLFEGSPAQMLTSLSRLAALPDDTLVHCAHEYTLSNLAFALRVDGDNPALRSRGVRERARREAGEATVPSLLAEERATNPFLRSGEPALRASAEAWAGRPLAQPLEVFAALRAWKNEFRA